MINRASVPMWVIVRQSAGPAKWHGGESLESTVFNQPVPEDLAELKEAAYLDVAGLSLQRQSQIISISKERKQFLLQAT